MAGLHNSYIIGTKEECQRIEYFNIHIAKFPYPCNAVAACAVALIKLSK